MALGKSVIAFLHSIPQAVTFEMPKKKQPKKSWLYYELEEAFNDVRLMKEGKKEKRQHRNFSKKYGVENDFNSTN